MTVTPGKDEFIVVGFYAEVIERTTEYEFVSAL